LSQYVIVGDGAAGTTAAYYIRRNDPSGRIMILCDDPQPAYYRAALTNYLIGELREEQLFAVPPDFYTRYQVERLLTRVATVDAASSSLTLTSGGAPIPYDQLLIAAGADPTLPPWPGTNLSGVMTMRTMQDARTVMDGLAGKQIRNAVIVGAGPLGVEWVQGMRNRGVEVSYVIRGDLFMDGILDRTASDLVWSRLRQAGVDLRLNEEVAEVLGSQEGRVRGVRLKNSGDTVESQLVGVAIGIRGNTQFLQGSGVSTDRGIPVDEHMRTNIPNVFAAGDIASVYDPLSGSYRGYGLWEPARLQGRVSGINMSGGEARYDVGVQYNATRLWDLDFGGVGRTLETPEDEVSIDFPRTGGKILYRKLIFRGPKLEGALMVGLRKEGVRRRALQFKRLIELGLDVSGVKDKLLDDERFDLASWLESREQEMVPAAAVAEVTPSPAVPTNAQLRGASGVFKVASTLRPPGAVAPTGTLVLRESGHQFELKIVTKVGRGPDNDLVLADDYASAHHAEIRLEVSSWVVSDVGSRNGTFVNEVPIMAPTPLRQGDVLRMGYTHMVLSGIEAQPGPSAGFGHQAAAAWSPGGSASKPPTEAAVQQQILPAGTVLGYIQLNGSRFDLAAQVASLGRDPGSDVPINDPTVSYTHAQVTRLGNDLYLRDVGSRNGTYVNTQLVTIPHVLREGDVIRVGQTDLVFHAAAGVPSRPAEPALARPAAVAPPPPAAPPPPLPVSTAAPTPPAPTPPQPPTAPMPPAPIQPAPPAPSAPPATPGQARLVVTSGPAVGVPFALTRDSARAGRDSSNDIVIRDPTISRNHARFDRRASGWTVTDLGSLNGTSVNGRRIAPNTETPLPPSATVQLGDVILSFETT
jgi:pSer/pThr/pTyr-binding forkhead associated (FHA) protein/NADPH-dependent 2,4-dienoyl-CoA reductase/sulfur reductase-like enzyme